MKGVKSFVSSRTGKMVLAAAIVMAFAAPALAEHFDFGDLTGDTQVTAADLHVDCPEPGEDQTEEEATAACDAVVQEAAQGLEESDHPENHGKYVSFLAHCLTGMKGKGESMRQVAQADEDGQMEVAVKLCAEWKLEQQAAEDEASEVSEVSEHGKGKKDSLGEEDEDSAESEDGPGGQGKGKGRGRGQS